MDSHKLIDKLKTFKDLKENWNSGYSSIPPTKEAYDATLNFIFNICDPKNLLPDPDVFPVPDGNIQIEWSIHGIDLELEIYHQNHFHFLFEMWEEPYIVGSDMNKIEITISKHIVSTEDKFFIVCLQELKRREFNYRNRIIK